MKKRRRQTLCLRSIRFRPCDSRLRQRCGAWLLRHFCHQKWQREWAPKSPERKNKKDRKDGKDRKNRENRNDRDNRENRDACHSCHSCHSCPPPLFTGIKKATREQGDFLLLFFLLFLLFFLLFFLLLLSLLSPPLFTGIFFNTREQSGGRMCICGVCCALHNHSSPVSGEEFVRAERLVNCQFSIFNNNTCSPSFYGWGAGVILCVWFYFLPRFSQCSVSHWRTGRS